MTENQAKLIQEASTAAPVCVDLDGTLILTDSLLISVSRCLRRRPFHFVRLLFRLFLGKAAFKMAVVKLADLDAKDLPYRSELLEWLRDQKRAGNPCYLTTGAPQEMATAVANHLGLFTGVISSSARENLVGVRKRNALVERFGHAGFDYVGDSKSDILVWESARVSYVVGSKINPASVKCHLRSLGGAPPRSGRDPLVWARALRMHQWAKNLLVFLPLIASQRWNELGLWLSAGTAFVSWCLLSSAGYIINDLLDIEDDCKRTATAKRPLATGQIGPTWIICMLPMLVILGGLGAFAIGTPFLAMAMSYLACSITYTAFIKRRPMADVIFLALLYISRIIGGGLATDIYPSVWLLMFSLFAFSSLAFLKRFTELRQSPENAVAHGRAYQFEHRILLSQLGISCAICAILVVALYVQSPEVLKVYRAPSRLLLTCPLILYSLARLWYLGWTGRMEYDPLVTCLRDRPTRFTACAIALVVVLARY